MKRRAAAAQRVAKRCGLVAVVVGAALLPGGSARAQDARSDDSPLHRWWAEVSAELARAAESRRRKPPRAVTVVWKKRLLGEIDLEAPLLDLAARDLDGNGKAELFALTSRELAVVRPRRRGKLVADPELALPVLPPAIRSRDPIGALSIDDAGQILARTSDQSEGIAAEWSRGRLSEVRRLAGFPVCADAIAEVVPGRNRFAATSLASTRAAPHRAVAADVSSMRCATDLVDPAGVPVDLFGSVGLDDRLSVHCLREGGACDPGTADRDYEGVGHAFELTDVNNDGHPEVITSSSAPRDGKDKVSVYAIGVDGVTAVFETTLDGGVIAFATGDIDGDGDRDVVSAVRVAGGTKVELWTLN